MSKKDNPAAENHPRFSFVVVSFNTLPLTRAAIFSIAKHAVPFPHEVILVDNHSTDGSVAELRQEFGVLKTIELEENRGFAAANNAGAKVAEGDWLILMNSDAELLADTMPVIDDLLRRHPQLDVLGGQLLNPDGSSQTSVLSNFHRVRREQQELVEVSGIVGAFMVVRRALWQKLNGMDEGVFFYGEDLDFCERAIAAGAVLRYSPRFSVVHHGGGSSSNKADLRAIIEGWESRHYLWRKEMSEQEYRANVRRCGVRFFFRVVWYFSLSLVTGFLLRAFSGRLRKYFHLLKWHWHGCPAGWGFRPVSEKSF
jgi:GT2 family glycosyltransferase